MVPEQGGGWGWLLPSSQETSRIGVKPHDHGNVVEINSACLRLVGSMENRRGEGALLAIVIGVALAFIVINLVMMFDTGKHGYTEPLLVFTIGGSVLSLLGFLAANRAVTAPVQDTVIISRRLRRFYGWNRKDGWLYVDYDKAVAFVSSFKLVTTTGAADAYPLRVVELIPGSRRIARSISPTRPFGRPDVAAEVWEFIRRYMGSDPAAVPPVALMPAHRINAVAWMDRELYPDLIDRQHLLAFPAWRARLAILVVRLLASLSKIPRSRK